MECGHEQIEARQAGLGTAGGRTDETTLADDRMGNNRLQGNDQKSVRNQRHAVASEGDETEGVIESFENLDPKLRADRQRQKKQ
jgi:hypothetical protein